MGVSLCPRSDTCLISDTFGRVATQRIKISGNSQRKTLDIIYGCPRLDSMTIYTSSERSTRLVPEFGIGDRLRKARELKGLSQSGLGALVGLSHKIIGNIERGTTPIDGLQIYGWAEICDIDPTWIKTGEGSPYTGPQDPDGGIPNNVHPIGRRVGSSETDELRVDDTPKAQFYRSAVAFSAQMSSDLGHSSQTFRLAA